MCRAQIKKNKWDNSKVEDSRIEWERWLRQNADDREFGKKIGRAMRATIERQIESVRKENDDLKEKMKEYSKLENHLTLMGIDITKTVHTWTVDDRIDRAKRVLPHGFKFAIERLIDQAQSVQKHI